MVEGARLKGLRSRLVVELVRVGPIAHIVPLTVAARHGGKDSGGETPAPNTTIVRSITMGLGFITIAAAEAAEAGEGIEEVVVEVVEVRQAISKTYLLDALDTTKYGRSGFNRYKRELETPPRDSKGTHHA